VANRFSDFSMTYGFHNFYGEMDVNLDITKDFTIFAVVKIDFNVSSYRYLNFYMGKKGGFKTLYHFQKLDNIVTLQTEFDGTNVFLDLTGDKSKFINKQIMLWSTKKGNKLSTTIAGIDPIETVDTRAPRSQDTKNIHFQSIQSAYLLRMGFTTNSYAIGGHAFHAMVSAEKKLGTYFGLD